jgi:hypothetical protein
MALSDLTIPGVERYILEHNLGTIDEVMDQFPQVLRENYVLMDKSRSRQPSSDAEFPRIVMYLPNGTFFVGIATDPSQENGNYNDLEILEFTSDGRWDLRAITMNGVGFIRSHQGSEDTRGRCIDCHGEHNRPIWGSYTDWQGAFQEQLSAEQAQKLSRVLTTDDHRNRRLRKLTFEKSNWQENDVFQLPNQYRGYANESLNQVIGMRHLQFLRNRTLDALQSDLLFLASVADSNSLAPVFSEEVRGRIQAYVDRRWDERPDLKRKYPHALQVDKALALNGLDPHLDLLIDRTLPECVEPGAPQYYFSDWSTTTARLRFVLFQRAIHDWRRDRQFSFNRILTLTDYEDHYGLANTAAGFLDKWMYSVYRMDVPSHVSELKMRPYATISLHDHPVYSDAARDNLAETLREFTEQLLEDAESREDR